jgi:hypothetical protein
MNLSEIKELKEGDEITFAIPFTPFTEGKKYKVLDFKESGKWVKADNGINYPLVNTYYLNDHFRTEKPLE